MFDDIPYRTTPNLAINTAPVYSKDDIDNGTLKDVYKDLKNVMDTIDSWHAFDLQEADGLDIKMQIKAHQLAYEMLQPAIDAIESALAKTDEKFRDRS